MSPLPGGAPTDEDLLEPPTCRPPGRRVRLPRDRARDHRGRRDRRRGLGRRRRRPAQQPRRRRPAEPHDRQRGLLGSAYDVVKHLYVEDGDLAAQDETAKEIAAARAEADETLGEIEPRLDTDGRQGHLRRLLGGHEALRGGDRPRRSSSPARRPSTRSRSATARATSTSTTLMPIFEQLDKLHDELEGAVTAQADKSADEADASAQPPSRRTVLIVAIARRAAGRARPGRSSPPARSSAPWPRSATACAACTTTA